MDEQRKSVVAEAYTWLRTPYHHLGMVKGAGVDCATLIHCVYANAGVIQPFKIDHYPMDWHLHRDAERYLGKVLEYALEVEKPLPGDIVLWKFGRVFSHGAIVTDWPMCIHAYIGRNVELLDVDHADWLNWIGNSKTPRERKYFSYWGK